MINIKFYLLFFLLGFVGFSEALVLDWSGSYKLEKEWIQNIGQEEGRGDFRILHNLRLQADIKAYDGVRVKSLFHLVPFSQVSAVPSNVPSTAPLSTNSPYYLYQNGDSFGLFEPRGSPFLAVRDLYINFSHNFGVLEVGWKPHHFGLGMFYNDGQDVLSPAYNNSQGSRGVLSWKAWIGSSYYIQPMVHYIDDLLFNLLIQGGLKQDFYGFSVIYKPELLGWSNRNEQLISQWTTRLPSYFGIYAYYQLESLEVQTEGGQSGDTYGATFKGKWATPFKKLNTQIDLGISTSDSVDPKSAFYFDPSFSSQLFFLAERHEGLKSPAPEYLKNYLFYSFHSAFYVAPRVSFSLLDSLELSSMFSTHFSYPGGELLLYGVDFALQYQKKAGFRWITRVGLLFPEENDLHIGINSTVAISF